MPIFARCLLSKLRTLQSFLSAVLSVVNFSTPLNASSLTSLLGLSPIWAVAFCARSEEGFDLVLDKPAAPTAFGCLLCRFHFSQTPAMRLVFVSRISRSWALNVAACCCRDSSSSAICFRRHALPGSTLLWISRIKLLDPLFQQPALASALLLTN